jgi:hypothetical protein
MTGSLEDTALMNVAVHLCEIDGIDPFEQADGGFTLRFAGREFTNWQTRIQEARKLRYGQRVEVRP